MDGYRHLKTTIVIAAVHNNEFIHNGIWYTGLDALHGGSEEAAIDARSPI